MTAREDTWIDETIADAHRYTNMTEPAMRFVAESFIEAHRAVPGGLSVEVGTCHGGSALMQLELLARLYPVRETRPMLFTVDPYGNKPYLGGDNVVAAGLYGAADFVAMKLLLAAYPNHAHWYCRGIEFFRCAPGLCYWNHGKGYLIDQLAFALLDGDHDALTIGEELDLVYPRLAPGGVVVVDNIDKDPRMADLLVHWNFECGPERKAGARQARIRKET